MGHYSSSRVAALMFPALNFQRAFFSLKDLQQVADWNGTPICRSFFIQCHIFFLPRSTCHSPYLLDIYLPGVRIWLHSLPSQMSLTSRGVHLNCLCKCIRCVCNYVWDIKHTFLSGPWVSMLFWNVSLHIILWSALRIPTFIFRCICVKNRTIILFPCKWFLKRQRGRYLVHWMQIPHNSML